MLGCNKGYTRCIKIYRIVWVSFVLLFFSLFFFYLTKHRSLFFFLFVSSLSSSTERILLQYTMPWQRRYVSVYMCSVSRERRCCPSYSFIQSFIDSNVVYLFFFTTDTRLSVCMFKLDYIIFQKKKEEKKRESRR